MLNPYAVRPIGSDKFFEHLKDIQTKEFYSVMFPIETEIEIHGIIPWKSMDVFDPYTSLSTAIVASAILDYLELYEAKEYYFETRNEVKYWVYNSRCICLENDYFRQNPILENLFDKLLVEVCWDGNKAINDCKKRIKHVLRWTQQTKRMESEIKVS